MNHNYQRLKTSLKWVIVSILVGLVVGLVGTAFFIGMNAVTTLRTHHTWLILLLPFGGILIVFLYKFLHDEHDSGTNLVISAIHSGEEVPLRMVPLIFISTLATHLFGGSAGREGAALQFGGSIGNSLGRLFRFDEKDQHIMIMAGMSAAFSTLFGAPMAAAIFSMEVVSVGIMHYSALVPCVLSALVANGVATHLGISHELFQLQHIPTFTLVSAIKLTGLSILCAFVSMLFCITLHKTEHLYQKYIKSPYMRAFAGGCMIILLTLWVGSQTYNGTGLNVIEQCMNASAAPETFLLKILFTALTLGAGYKGGEIVPSLFIGASFGSLFANLLGLPYGICATVGMTSVFCGVTNCPLTSLLISFELFGYDGMPFYLLAVSFSYMLSGYFSLYKSQKIVYSKFKTNYINKQAH
jgi:H+/Cl- antiporter ClcA